MRKHTFTRVAAIVLNILLAITLLSCGDDKDTPTPDTNDPNSGPKGTLRMHLHIYLDETEVDAYNVPYTTTSDRKISLNISQFYLSNFQLVKYDGTVLDVPNVKILKTREEQTYTIGDVPVGNYKTIKFRVGLNPTENKLTPTTSSTDILNKPEMWFGSTAQPDGYVFFNLAGKIDTTSNANGLLQDMQPFHYRIGTDANYAQVTMPENVYTIIPDQTSFIHLYADCNRVFSGIKLNDKNNLTMTEISENNSQLAHQLVNNLSSIFVYE